MTSPCRYDVLSPGEMQRLSFARLFYLQPKYAGLSVHVSNVFMKSMAEQRRRRGSTAGSDLIAKFSNLDLPLFLCKDFFLLRVSSC